MSREYIANTLRRLREKSEYTADQVGAMVGKSGKTVNAWENNRGQPDAEILMQLCDIYGVNDVLAEFQPTVKETIILTPHEAALISAYRNSPSMQAAVDRILNISDDEQKTQTIYRAARSVQNSEHEIEQRDGESMKKFADAPKVTKEEDL